MRKYLWVYLVCLVSFACGLYVGQHEEDFYGLLAKAPAPVRSKMTSPGHHLFPVRYSEAGITQHIPDKTAPGVTLLTSYWPETAWSPGIRLIDAAGNTLHHWEVKPHEIWPESPHDDHIRNHKNFSKNYVHGTYLFPDGDILFNIEYLTLVRMDACGNIRWKLPRRTHHSVFRGPNGNFWVPVIDWIDEDDPRKDDFPGFRTPFTDEKILEVSPGGEILSETSVLDAFFSDPYRHLFWQFNHIRNDVMHINDAEVFGPRQAAAFPDFSEGDLLISSKYLNLIAVLGRDQQIKWIEPGVFTYQHDPDIEEGGWIGVFDNRTEMGESRIIGVHPATGRRWNIYPGATGQPFYTAAGGKHQKLSNGNRLIAESRAGRVFEITPEGEIVWEWIQQPAKKKLVAEVLEATRYPFTKDDIRRWQSSCT